MFRDILTKDVDLHADIAVVLKLQDLLLNLLVLGLQLLDEHVDFDAQLVDYVLLLLVFFLKLLGEDDIHLLYIALFLENPRSLFLLKLSV